MFHPNSQLKQIQQLKKIRKQQGWIKNMLLQSLRQDEDKNIKTEEPNPLPNSHVGPKTTKRKSGENK